MNKLRPIVSVVCCAMLFTSSTWAATLEPGQGNLTINQGQGFQPVSSRIDANVGDSVMVGPGGSATLVYDDGCTVNVQPGSVTTIAPISPCASGSNAQDSGWAAWGIGALAAGGIAAGIVAASHTPSNASVTTSSASP